MFSSPFENQETQVSIPDNADIVFVSDLFSSDHVGGAELTTDSIIDSSPFNVFRLHSKDVNEKTLSQGIEKYWIFGNFASMNLDYLPGIISQIKYSIVEYDYKYCKYRSPEKHAIAESKPCDCNEDMHGKMISAFYYGAKSLWWMSTAQKEIYHSLFPFLGGIKNTVLSSVFSREFFEKAEELSSIAEKKIEAGEVSRDKWIVVGSNSWIKGVDDSIKYCVDNGLDYELVENMNYNDLLEKLSTAYGLVFLPKGGDTCPRITIEAKILGCKLVLNENVQHANEKWFITEDIKEFGDYLYSARERFWHGIAKDLNHKPTISGYTTTYNCLNQNYPFQESILSLIGFCDQVVVVDGGSTDGTWEVLQKLTEAHEKLIIHQQPRDWENTRFAVFDGLQKALARALCTAEFCWQQDSDEIVHENDYDKILSLINQAPKNMDLIALPVIEFWGSKNKIRIDSTPWKWRLSRNRPHITHGIPESLRQFDSDGNLYALPGTDGCDYVRSDTYEPIPFANFYTSEIHQIRESALSGDEKSLSSYKEIFNNVKNQLPSIYHYSWFDLERKIKTYKNYWSKHWQSLYNIEQEDVPDNNMFFNKKWSKVTDKEIEKLAKKLEKEMGGWIFHTRVDFSNPTPSINFEEDHPEVIKSWIKKEEKI